MKILHITERFGAAVVGGAQQSVELLAKAQAALGHEVGVICVRDDDSPEVANPYSFPVWQIPLNRTSRALRDGHLNKLVAFANYFYEGNVRRCDERIAEVVQQFQPDVVNTHILTGISEDVWRVLADRGVPVVHTLRDFFLLCARSSMYKRGDQCSVPCAECRVITAKRRSLVQGVAGIVGSSQRIIDIHVTQGAIREGQSTAVIPNSVALKDEAVVARTELAARPFIYGFMGRLVATKGVEQLILAFRGMTTDAELWIAGDGDPVYVEQLKRLSEGAAVKFLGKVDAMGFLSKLDAIVIPSLWEEPFGRVVAEALMARVPVICSDRGAFPEILKQFPGGLLTRPESIEAFRECLVAMREQQSRFAAYLDTAAPGIRAHFSTQAIGERYVDFYRQVLGASMKAA